MPAHGTPHHQVQDPAAAAFLVNYAKNPLMNLLMARGHSLAELAEARGLSKSRVSYWLGKLMGLGLVEIVRVERRGRYRTPIYQAVARSFVFPVELLRLSYEDVLELAYGDFWPRTKRSLAHAAHRYASGWQVQVVQRGAGSQILIEPAGQSMEAARIFNYYGRLYLSDEQGQALRAEMGQLVERYAALSSKATGHSHLFCVLATEEQP